MCLNFLNWFYQLFEIDVIFLSINCLKTGLQRSSEALRRHHTKVKFSSASPRCKRSLAFELEKRENVNQSTLQTK